MLNSSDIPAIIAGHVTEIAALAGRSLDGVGYGQTLADDVGLDSLQIASLFIALEDEFQVDPFSERFSIVEMRTIADLANAYGTVLADAITGPAVAASAAHAEPRAPAQANA